MATTLLSLVLLATLVAAPPPAVSPPQSSPPQTQSERIRNGVQHFERAFYGLTPKKHDAEAAREFDLAIAEFEAEAAAQPSSATAHAYLGRIYSIRKDHRKAAAHFDRLSEVQPSNTDAYVLAALAYAEDGQITEARARLEAARRSTSDPDVLARLAGYMSKLDNGKR